ncbi:MAG: LptE family protein [Deltaproteobacteria bacterium]|nr:LptE family protein [Deltaproteobacteria bacterium]
MWCRKWSRCTAALTAVWLLLVGCGYQLKGRHGSLPEDMRTIAIPVMQNRTNEPGLETTATRIFIEEFNRRTELKVVTEDRADVVLRGEIQDIYVSPLSYGANEHASERRVTLTMGFQLEKRDGDKPVENVNGLSFQEGYEVVPDDPLATDANQKVALNKILSNLAEKVNEMLFRDF